MPADHFACFDMPRRPSIDAGELKERFHRLTAEHHPDVTGDAETFTALNAAYAVLRDPAARLRHLLELEPPEATAAPAAAIPPALADRFMQVAATSRALDGFAQSHATAASPLARALAADEGASLRRDAERVLGELETARERCLRAVDAEDAAWDRRDAAALSRLATLQHELSFLKRWDDQLREGLLRLSL